MPRTLRLTRYSVSVMVSRIDSRHDHRRGSDRAPHRPATVVKGVAKPACPATRLGPFLLQPGGHRIRKVSLTESPGGSVRLTLRAAGQHARRSQPSTGSDTKPPASRPTQPTSSCPVGPDPHPRRAPSAVPGAVRAPGASRRRPAERRRSAPGWLHVKHKMHLIRLSGSSSPGSSRATERALPRARGGLS